MPNSLIQGKTWYWREGYRQMPIHCDTIIPTKELCLPIDNIEDGGRILSELKKHKILANVKRTHASSKYIPEDTLLVCADINQDKKEKQEEENIEKLKSYIEQNGGKIINPLPPTEKVLSTGFWGRFFARGGK